MVNIKEIKNNLENIMEGETFTNADIFNVIKKYVDYVNEKNLEREKQNFPHLDDDFLSDCINFYLAEKGLEDGDHRNYRKLYLMIRNKFKIYG